MVAKKTRKTKRATKAGKKIKDLSIKTKDVKGGRFLNFGDIKGESTESGHERWVT